jgi:hypothetical protein
MLGLQMDKKDIFLPFNTSKSNLGLFILYHLLLLKPHLLLYFLNNQYQNRYLMFEN